MTVDAQGFLARKRLESKKGGSMTKQDYETIAAVIRNSMAFYSIGQRAVFILDMEDALRETNENWDSKLWHDACRPEERTYPVPYGVLKAYPFTPPAPRRVQ